MEQSILYQHLPRELPNNWVRSNYASATHIQAYWVFNHPTAFRDVYLRYLALKDPDTALVRACSKPPKTILASKKEERDALLQRRAVFMGSDEKEGGNWDARIRSWLGIKENSGKDGELQFNERLQPIKRESLEELLWRLGLQPYDLPEECWCGRSPYHRAERNWREGKIKLPKKLPKIYKEKLLEPLRREVPELHDLTEEELAGVLFLIKVNPPYGKKPDPKDLTKERRDRLARESELQLTRILTQLYASREERALELLKKELAKELGEDG